VPFKSQAQRRKFAQLLVQGRISKDAFEEWNRETGNKKLPEHVRGTAKKSARRKKSRPLSPSCSHETEETRMPQVIVRCPLEGFELTDEDAL
jgi:hypothetical protein